MTKVKYNQNMSIVLIGDHDRHHRHWKSLNTRRVNTRDVMRYK